MEHDTAHIMTLIARDNQRAFDTFYHLYYTQVFRTAYYYLKDTEACREVVSNVFFSVWQSRNRLGEVRNLESWLFILTKNESLHYISQQLREADRHSLSDETGNVPLEIAQTPDTASPEADLISSELEESLSRIVSELPEKCRIIFLMSREEGMNSKEIAGRLDIAESTVRVQLKLALEKITARLRMLYPHLSLVLVLGWLLGAG